MASAMSNHSSVMSTRSKRHRSKNRMNYANLYSRASESEDMYEFAHGAHGHYHHDSPRRMCANGLYSKNMEGMSVTHTDDISPEDAADAVSFFYIILFFC